MEKQKKTGRPRKPTDEVKGKQIRVRLTDDEKEKLESLASHYSVSQSELIRILINNYCSLNEVLRQGGKANV